MAPVSCLEIIDWKEEKCEGVNVTKPEVLSCFTRDWNGNIPIKALIEPLDDFENWRNMNDAIVKEYNFTTDRNTLSYIMNTPFEIMEDKRKWTILAKYDGDTINLKQENNTILSETLNKHYDQLKRYLFIGNPQKLNSKTTSLFYQSIYDIIQINIGDNRVLYSAECPAVDTNEGQMNFEKFIKSERIFCDIIDINEFRLDRIQYNPFWWSKAKLSNARLGFIGVCNSVEDRLQNIIKFNTDIFVDTTKYENLWSPIAAWTFLDMFLSFVKQEFKYIKAKYRNKCLLKFTSYDNNKEAISCEPLIEKTLLDGSVCYEPLL
ncbi:hypothetical protein O3M35_001161 [Rhynocoris fuscipes]|uniref:Decapping nuclease n=1 Tax=Rhynocoris fuscipes TaxID=488301 RepID=A0AAW1DQA5_9HEMI